MSFDPVSYAMGKAAGGGGGGGSGKNAYTSFNAPTAGEGSNGDYWFQLLEGVKTGYAGSVNRSANTPIAGWQFTVTEALKVVGLRGQTKVAVSNGYLKFGTLTDILAEVQTNFTGGEWDIVYLDNPITLIPETDYIVMIFGNASTLVYNFNYNLTFHNGIQYKQARFGSYPGKTEVGNTYSADILIEDLPPYQVDKQYYKSGGIWSVVT